MELPVEFKEYAIAALGEEVASELFDAIGSGEEVTSVRVNPLKEVAASPNTCVGMPEECFPDYLPAEVEERVPWTRLGYYLKERPVFTLDPLFHAGAYYVQEASSMYMELAMAAIEKDFAGRYGGEELSGRGFFDHDIAALDLCAAPGGKSTHLASLLGKDSLLVSNEVIKSRSVVLADNIAKWGCDNVVVTNNDPADFGAFEEFFDLIVVDAPCSGEGLFRKEPEAISEWSPANVELCAQRQQRILTDIWPALKPGGYLVYSTCTYNKFENDGNLEWLKNKITSQLCTIASESGVILTKGGGLQFVPGRVKGEGQFMAVVRKGGEWETSQMFRGGAKPSNSRINKDSKGKNQPQLEKGCTYLPDNYVKILQGDLVKAYRKELHEKIKYIEENLRVVLSGIAVANKKGKDYVPHADFALQGVMASMVATGTLPQGISAVEVSREDALRFLAKEPLVLPGAPMGYVLLVYRGLGLGFVKNLGNRTNNLLPMARRIRMRIE
ncbi:MAG: rRNA cytosine-C5-methyltransferase [Bacteroidales bacterium]|nr:rRNA cytosine-C5-methyltransferase [Bacteroidales bacterium]